MPAATRARALLPLLLALAVGGAACGDDDSGGERGGGTTTTTTAAGGSTTTTAPATSTTALPRPDLAAVAIRLTPVAMLDQPVAMAVRPGSSTLYIAEKTGRIRVLDGSDAPLLDLSAEVSSGGEQGLLGLAFSPDGAFLYADFTNRSGDTRLEEWAMGAGPRAIDAGSRRLVLAVDQPAANHNGGTLAFGPDGHLWFGLGDGGGSGDRYHNAQNTGTLLGDLLRIDPRPAGGSAYSTPTDNPFAASGGRPELAVIGARNPWKWSFDRATGDLWIGDVGQDTTEEIDVLPAGHILGANLGWPYLEGTRAFSGGKAPDGVTAPVHEYSRSQGQSVVGGYVYRGTKIPAMAGAYLFTDTYKSSIRLLDPAGGAKVRDTGLLVPGGMAVSFGQDADGELYVLSLGGGVYRIDPT